MDQDSRSSPEHRQQARTPSKARQATLQEIINTDGYVSVATTARELGISEMTVRRDLDALEKRGLVIRTHGGAVAPQDEMPPPVDLVEPSFDTRCRKNAGMKTAIGKAAAEMVLPGETIGIDVGTSTYYLALGLAGRKGLKIFTNNLRAAPVLDDIANQVYLTGGRIHRREMSINGSIAVEQLGGYWFNRVFIGAAGLTDKGCFDFSLEDTEVKKLYLSRSDETVVLCDSTKFERMSVGRICGFESVDTLVTDSMPVGALKDALDEASVQIVIASP
ncbi:MAG: DeoR/GlpR transcriptional regulator [Rhodospirillaceae bacterium]|nr:DeoR/GlpR transcriptional regulator [Rhodospirillaceae bacterium]